MSTNDESLVPYLPQLPQGHIWFNELDSNEPMACHDMFAAMRAWYVQLSSFICYVELTAPCPAKT